MAVQADHVLYLAAGLFGMAPSRAITNDLTTRANVNTLAAELGNTQFTKDFYPVFNDAKAAKLADVLLGNAVSAETKNCCSWRPERHVRCQRWQRGLRCTERSSILGEHQRHQLCCC